MNQKQSKQRTDIEKIDRRKKMNRHKQKPTKNNNEKKKKNLY